MSFIRPEAREALWRGREIIAGLAALLLGAFWALGPGGLLGWAGVALMIAGALICVIGVQRARFRPGRGGPGVVSVDEGRISYFGPLTGGAVAASELRRLSLDRTGKPAHWVLEQSGQSPLHIPVNAKGAEALFDAFAALPGLRTEHLLAALNRPGAGLSVVWDRGGGTRPRLR